MIPPKTWASMVLSLAVAVTAVAAPPVEVEVSWLAGDGGVLPADSTPEGRLVLRRVDGGITETRTVAVPMARGALRLPAGSVWSVETDLESFWAPVRVVSVDSEEITVLRLPLFALGRIEGTLRLEGDSPKHMFARFRTAPEAGKPALGGRVPCALMRPDSADATDAAPAKAAVEYRCGVPVGRWDVTLTVPGFVPHYLWDFTVPERSPGTVELTLRQGASLSGFVVAEPALGELSQAEARLAPKVSRRGLDGILVRVQDAEARTKVLDNGFFLLSGVEPGVYTLEIEHPGAATARVPAIEILPERENQLTEPIELLRPFRGALQLQPAVDWMDRPWRTTVYRRSELTGFFDDEPIYQGTAGKDGRVELSPQAPGLFRLDIADSLGNRFLSTHLELTGQEEAPSTVELDLVTATGGVFLGDDPLAATLWFGGAYGEQRVEVAADEEGRWSAVLPRGGSWKVEVHSSEPMVRSEVRVDVSPDAEGRARVDLHLPDTEVFGRVVDEADRPVERASVGLETASQNLDARTDSRGRFRFRAVAEGQSGLHARKGELRSQPSFVRVEESVPAGPVVLRLSQRELAPLRFQVRSEMGPVAGAKVVAEVLAPVSPFLGSTHTDLTGHGEIAVPAEADIVQLSVLPPGLALRAFRVAPSANDSAIELFVSGEGGSVVVAAEDHDWTRRVLVLQGDLVLNLAYLGEWMMGHGEVYREGAPTRFPRLAPGPYQVCAPRRVEMVRVAAEGGSWRDAAIDCQTGFLEPHGLLRFDLTDE